MHNRAVSNTLGYVLLFAVVITSLTVVGTVGVGSLEDARDGTLLMNAEQSMQGVASAAGDVHREDVSRTSRVRIRRGSLQPGDETTITVRVLDSSDGSTTTVTKTFKPIVYRSKDVRVVYEGGAVIRQQDGGSVAIREPSYVLSQDRAIVPVVGTTPNSESSESVSGSNAQVHLSRLDSQVKQPTTLDSGDEITVQVDTSGRRTGAWNEILESVSGPGCLMSGPASGPAEVTCTINSDDTAVVVRSITIGFRLST